MSKLSAASGGARDGSSSLVAILVKFSRAVLGLGAELDAEPGLADLEVAVERSRAIPRLLDRLGDVRMLSSLRLSCLVCACVRICACFLRCVAVNS